MSLATLRTDPTGSCQANIYQTQGNGRSFPPKMTVTGGVDTFAEGGRCTIRVVSTKSGFYLIEADRSDTGTDYFYPWVLKGVGWVKVPKNAPDGTIVMTGGMNGCSIIVSESGNDFYFYHDGDSKYLRDDQVVGPEVARVGPKDYDPFDWGKNMLNDLMTADPDPGKNNGTGGSGYGHFVVAVKKSGRFGFYVTGFVLFKGKMARAPRAVTPCIVTFE